MLAAGQSHDILAAPTLLQGDTAEAVLADRAYDANALRSLIADSGAKAVIPSTRSRSAPIPHDPIIYRCRNRIERCFSKLKHFRRFATRYDRRAIHFRKRNVENGPSPWETADTWTEIAEAIARGDVKRAASSLGHYLEHIGVEACQALRAPVEYRADGQYDLGDLLLPATAELRRRLKEAKAAANSWGNTEASTAMEAFETSYAAAVHTAGIEQWQMNAAIHFNTWANLEKAGL